MSSLSHNRDGKRASSRRRTGRRDNVHDEPGQPASSSSKRATGNESSGNAGSFSKIHLSALFQRRRQAWGDDEKRRDDTNGHATGADDGGVHSPNEGGNMVEDDERTNMHPYGPAYADDASPSQTYRNRAFPVASQSSASLPPLSNSSGWNQHRRRDSGRSISSLNRVRRMSSGIASLFSPRGANDENLPPQLDPLLVEVFENPQDVAAFSEALQDDAGKQAPSAAVSSIWPASNSLGSLGVTKETDAKQGSQERGNGEEQLQQAAQQGARGDGGNSQTHISHPRKVGRIAAVSDFAPVNERTQRKRPTDIDSAASREGLLYKIVRFPLLLSIFLVIATEFAAYVLIRQLVNLTEYFIAWRGYRGTLRTHLRRAQSLEEWRDTALELDSYLGYEQWKCQDASGMYDWILIKKVLRSLQEMRTQGDAEGVLSVLELCLRNNFAGIENFRLYSETFFGTKYLIENYLSEVEESLNFISSTDKIAPELKRQFYRSAQKNMGRSALCLSGGGSFGYYHIGVVRALLDANLLPNIITGTSAGGLIAALACTRTNEELKKLLVPELADRITACEEPINVWAKRFWQTGARFDLVQWAEKAQFFTRGSMTFAEAFARTGKTLNISVIPSDRHSPVKLLNHHTAPNCIIWSSLLASAAVPGLLAPVCLMQKTRSGKAVPWNWGHRFKDGSLRVDIPLQDLHSLFNVTYPIVSQVNPHVHLFFFAPKGNPGRPVAHRKGKGWRGGFLLSASEHVLKLNLSMNFKIIRDLDLLPSILGQDWSSVFLQRFGGAVTIWPKTRAWDWVRILSDPDRSELTRMLNVGQSVTFPKLHMVENRVRLERAIEQGRRANRRILKAEQRAAAANATSASAPGTSHDGHSTFNGHGDGGDWEGAESGGGRFALTRLERGGRTTQSDTDGTGEEATFFAPDNLPSLAIHDGEKDDGDAASARRDNMRRIQRRLIDGFSSRTSAKNGEGRRNDGAFTPEPSTTPGEQLPRHIRVRSMGLDDDDRDADVDDGLVEIDYARRSKDAEGAKAARRLRRQFEATVAERKSVPFPSSRGRESESLTTTTDDTIRSKAIGLNGDQGPDHHHHRHHRQHDSTRRDSESSSSSSSSGYGDGESISRRDR